MLALAVPFLMAAPAPAQSHIYDAGTAGLPTGPTAPTQQGWSLRSLGSVGLGPIVNDGGLNAWAISDTSAVGRFGYAYYYSNSPQVTNLVIGNPWELTVTMKPTAGPDANFFIEVNSGVSLIHAGYRIFFRIQGVDVVIENGYGTPLFTCVGAADGAYHTFSMRKADSVSYGDVQVLYDGITLGETSEDFPGGYAADVGVKFGTWADYGIARSWVHRVEFRSLDDLGARRCSPAVANSTGTPARLSATGSPYVNQNLLTMTASQMPTHALGYLLASTTAGFSAMPGGSQGNLCLGGSIGRFLVSAQSSGTSGEINVEVDLSSIPGNPPTEVTPGDTWTFQLWYRDANPAPTSNFTDALDIEFR